MGHVSETQFAPKFLQDLSGILMRKICEQIMGIYNFSRREHFSICGKLLLNRK